MGNSIGTILKQLRLARRYTQAQVAELVGISRKEISQYESGVRQPTSDMVISLASLYRVTTDYLFGLQEDQMIDASGLTMEEFQTFSELIAEMAEKNKRLNIK